LVLQTIRCLDAPRCLPQVIALDCSAGRVANLERRPALVRRDGRIRRPIQALDWCDSS
jgi:hypothetical protein